MQSLKYAVLGITPLLAAAGFAQGLSVGVKDGAFMQAQAGGPMGSGYAERPATNPMSDQSKGKTGTGSATSNQDKGSARSEGRKDNPTQTGPEARKDKKQQPKDSNG
jgi:hypothetical protein